ncbi:DUF4942 domain-containing protein [Cupriavidus sp. UYPR2.512]|uniref:DUF4942 domain-containing protein n=1 Tax=Cupriavidus sp. UYPR2.512 TaxID=1080187 RepID=UPI0003701350|nr:DUF4942 domain-containing protein [Cupriavidus sp. UYPR2.512]
METQHSGARDMFQFYPTPIDLATRVWKKLKNKHPDRVLEPSAGKGHLLKAMYDEPQWHGRTYAHVDCCEIDFRHHADLRELGVKIVGHDFLAMESGACYSAIIGNPPFHNGEKHVLKAWDLLWDGEVVMIINAETVRNPMSMERQRLVKLIEDFGDVEFVEGAFEVEDAVRKTSVDVAIVHLVKKADVASFVTMDLLRSMQGDAVSGEDLGSGYAQAQQLALPANEIENRVLIFNAAVESARSAIFAQAQASAYAGMLGDSMGARSAGRSDREFAPTVECVRGELDEAYRDLKGRAWASVVRSADVTSRLSSAAQKRVEAEFKLISELEFTVTNIYSFLMGICEQQGKIQIDMLCDTFDRITRYHSDNTAYYRGWRSNDKHYRSIGRRIRYTRFIIPGFSADSWHRSPPWEMQGLLADFDKGFALLSGDSAPEVSLVSVCNSRWDELKRGGRVESSYFDIRYYPGIGTIHFFPRDKKLIDRLNRVVGRHRGWLPAENLKLESSAFWEQYEKAEKLDKEIRKAVAKRGVRSYDDPFRAIDRESYDGHDQACQRIDEAMQEVHEANGIQVEFRLASATDASSATLRQLPLLAAA